MTRAQMRAKLRRRINEEVGSTAGGWTDAELNDELNTAYAWVQKEIVKAFPEAHQFWDFINTIAGTSWYPLPDSFGLKEVLFKSASTDTDYIPLDKKMFDDVRSLSFVVDPASIPPAQSSSRTYYVRVGQWIGLFPAPQNSVTAGLYIIHTPIMALSADTDIPRIKTPMHEAIVLKAKDQVLGDMSQAGDENRQKLADLINDIPYWYERDTDMPDRLSPRGL